MYQDLHSLIPLFVFCRENRLAAYTHNYELFFADYFIARESRKCRAFVLSLVLTSMPWWPSIPIRENTAVAHLNNQPDEELAQADAV